MSAFWEGLVLLAFLFTMGMLALGGDSAELDRIQAAADSRDRFYRACMPRKGDTVTAYWHKGNLECQRITPGGRYGRTFPHTENRIATLEDIQ